MGPCAAPAGIPVPYSPPPAGTAFRLLHLSERSLPETAAGRNPGEIQQRPRIPQRQEKAHAERILEPVQDAQRRAGTGRTVQKRHYRRRGDELLLAAARQQPGRFLHPERPGGHHAAEALSARRIFREPAHHEHGRSQQIREGMEPGSHRGQPGDYAAERQIQHPCRILGHLS